jgi:hypothetical protein
VFGVNEALWLVECGRLLEGEAGLRKIRLHDLRQHADFLIMPTNADYELETAVWRARAF